VGRADRTPEFGCRLHGKKSGGLGDPVRGWGEGTPPRSSIHQFPATDNEQCGRTAMTNATRPSFLRKHMAAVVGGPPHGSDRARVARPAWAAKLERRPWPGAGFRFVGQGVSPFQEFPPAKGGCCSARTMSPLAAQVDVVAVEDGGRRTVRTWARPPPGYAASLPLFGFVPFCWPTTASDESGLAGGRRYR